MKIIILLNNKQKVSGNKSVQRRNCTIDQYGNVLMGARLCAGEENGWNEIRKCGRSHLAIFPLSHSLRCSGSECDKKVSSVSSSNSELNSEL